MHLLMRALGIGPGDEVVTPSMTWVSTVNLIALAGATPVFVDVDRDTLMTTADRVEEALTPRTRLIVPVHFAGAALDLQPLRELAAGRGIPLVEDAAHSAGTDLLHAALLLWIAGAGHLVHGNVDLHAIVWLLMGSIPGVLIGSHLSIRVPDRALRVAFAAILILSGIKLVKVPAADAIIEAGVAVMAVAFVAWSVQLVRQRRVLAHDAA
jgi:hypothetical protein